MVTPEVQKEWQNKTHRILSAVGKASSDNTITAILSNFIEQFPDYHITRMSAPSQFKAEMKRVGITIEPLLPIQYSWRTVYLIDLEGPNDIRPFPQVYGLTDYGSDIFAVLINSTVDFYVISKDKELLNKTTYDIAKRLEPAVKFTVWKNGFRHTDSSVTKRYTIPIDWDDIILPQTTLTKVKSVADTFIESKELLINANLPWKKGVLLVGPPGTGKTLISRAINYSVDLPTNYVENLCTTNPVNNLENIFEAARNSEGSILIFEDIDGLMSPSLRRTFLNELDGFKDNNGLFIIASSNHPEQLDDAILKRPSRFDVVVHISPPRLEERERYINLYMDKPSIKERITNGQEFTKKFITDVASTTSGFTIPYIKEVLTNAFIKEVLAKRELGQPFREEVMRQIAVTKDLMKELRTPGKMAELNYKEALGFRDSGHASIS